MGHFERRKIEVRCLKTMRGMFCLQNNRMNIIIAQSGGPTCAINSSLAGVFKGPSYQRKLIQFMVPLMVLTEL